MRRFLGMGDPIIPVVVPAELLKLAVERGACVQALMDSSGMEPEILESGEGRVSYRQFGLLAQAVLKDVPDTCLGLALGERLVLERWGALGVAIEGAYDVAHALRLIATYGYLLAPQTEFALREVGSELELTLEQHVEKGKAQELASEALAAACFVQLKGVAEGALELTGVSLDIAGEDTDAKYSRFFGCPVVMGAKTTVLRLSRRACEARVRRASAPHTGEAEAECVQAMVAFRERRSVVTQVRALLRSGKDGVPDARTAARALQTSERSLRRALREGGASYQLLIDETRQELAMGYLKSTLVPVEEIARMAGFADGRSFRRAFKRWTGMTPVQARREEPRAPLCIADAPAAAPAAASFTVAAS